MLPLSFCFAQREGQGSTGYLLIILLLIAGIGIIAIIWLLVALLYKKLKEKK